MYTVQFLPCVSAHVIAAAVCARALFAAATTELSQ
jgi:hypothetical protein